MTERWVNVGGERIHWKWNEPSFDGPYELRLDIPAIVEQMHNLEEEATREAVIAWLREHGYTVEKNE